MTNLQIIKSIYNNENDNVGIIGECALDNAGFGGMYNELDYMPEVDLAEIVRHIRSIIDGRMLDYVSDSEYAVASSLVA